MISIPRSILSTFRLLLRKAGLNKRRVGPPSGVFIHAEPDACLIRCASPEVAIQYRHVGSFEPGDFNLPMDALDGVFGKADRLVTLKPAGLHRCAAAWEERGVPREKTFDAVKIAAFPSPPTEFVSNEPGLWSALRDAVPVTDPNSSRYALGCLHLRGKLGQIEATDGRHILTQNGFHFGWEDDVLLPTNQILGCKALDGDGPVQVGRAGDWIGFSIGDWLVMLAVQKEGRYPKLDDVIPKPETVMSRLEFSASDAGFLQEALPGLPCDDPVYEPITLDLNGQVLLRTREPEIARPTQVELPGSRLEGEPVMLHTNRRYLAQALRLGFRTIHCYGVKSPLLCADERRRFLWALLDEGSAIPRHDDPVRLISTPGAARPAKPAKPPKTNNTPNQTPEAPMTVPINQQQGTTTNNSKPQKRTRARPAGSTIEQALALRDTLRGIAKQAGDLARTLKQQKRQARIVASTLASLKELETAAG